MTAIQAVACDLFGTIVRLADPWFRRSAPALLGVSPRSWLAAVRQVGLRRAFPSVETLVEALAHAAGVESPEGKEALAAAVRAELARAQLVPGALTVLRFLRRRGLKTALISNLSSAHAQVIADLGLAELFDVKLLSCHLGVTKPSPVFFARLCQELALPPSQILVVGDSAAADGAARRLAFPVLLVGSWELPSFFHLGWYSWDRGELRRLLFEGQSLPFPPGSWTVKSMEPVVEGREGRYNLLARVIANSGTEEKLFFCKRFWDPLAAYVDRLARSLARMLDLPVAEADVVSDTEPLLLSPKVPGVPYQRSLDEQLSFDLGGHCAFAYVFANADIRPRNALVATDREGRKRLVLIDFEHCFLNLALPPEVVADVEAKGGWAELTLNQARGLAVRQVINPKTILRARNEFFVFREAPKAIREALGDGFARCWRRMQSQQDQLFGRIRAALEDGPPLRVGTWRFRRPLAAFDVEEMEQRLRQPLPEILALLMAEP